MEEVMGVHLVHPKSLHCYDTVHEKYTFATLSLKKKEKKQKKEKAKGFAFAHCPGHLSLICTHVAESFKRNIRKKVM